MFRSQSANRIDELYYKGMRLRRDAAARIGTKSGARGAQRRGGRLGDEVTSQTQAIQSIADITTVHCLTVEGACRQPTWFISWRIFHEDNSGRTSR